MPRLTQSPALEGYSALLSIGVATMLLAFLIARELLLASGSAHARRFAQFLTIASIPLLIGFLFIAGLKLSALAQPASAPASPTATTGGSPSASPSLSPVPTTSPATSPSTHDLVTETFNLHPIGSRPSAWTRQPRAASVSVAALPTRVDRSLRLDGSRTSSGAATCRGFSVATNGVLIVQVDIVLDALPKARSASIVVARGQAQRAVVSILSAGRLAYASGTRTRTLDDRLKAGVWYRATLLLDLDKRQYGWRIQDRQFTAPPLARSALGWRNTLGTDVDRVCLSSPPEALALYLDNVRVSR
jgi:hypothetical protein